MTKTERAAAWDQVVVRIGARHERSERRRRVCVQCRRRRSLFRYRGVVKADRDHTLCFQCYRALHDTMRARRVAARGFAAA